MNSAGYNGKSFFGGVHFIGDYFNVRIDKSLRTLIGHGQAGFFIGYRF
jgi:hypothetical protein